MNIKTFAFSTIVCLYIAASLFIFGIIALQLVPIIVATISACLSAILVTYLIDHIIFPGANKARKDEVPEINNENHNTQINDEVTDNEYHIKS